MKYIFLMLFLIPLHLQGALAPEIYQNAVSEIEFVTVYPDRARVFRTTEFDVKPGENTVAIDGMPEKMIDETLCAVSSSHPSFDVTSIASRADYSIKNDSTYLTLRTKMNQARDSYNALVNEQGFLNEQIANVRKFQPLAPGVKPGIIVSESWQKLIYFVNDQLSSMHIRWREIEKQRKESYENLKASELDFSKYQGYQKWSGKKVIITVHARTSLRVRVRFNYQVSNASWTPSYDLYSEDKSGQVKGVIYANVRQTTGEDWIQVPIELSTANIADELDLPTLKSWVIATDLTTINAAAPTDGTKINHTVKQSESPKINSPKIEAVKDYRLGSLNSESIYSDGKENRLMLMPINLKGAFFYRIMPESLTCGYAMCRMENNLKTPLLPGSAALWYEAQMIGKIDLPHISEGESFELPVGIDRGVKVSRKVDYYTQKKNWFSSKRVTDVTVEVTINNFTGNVIDIELDERIPVTTQPDLIKVKNVTCSLPEKKVDHLPAGVKRYAFSMNKTQVIMTLCYTLEYDPNVIVTFGDGDPAVPNVGFGPEIEPLDPMK